jgi:hypothetical protein
MRITRAYLKQVPKVWFDAMYEVYQKAHPKYTDDQIAYAVGSTWAKLSERNRERTMKRLGATYEPT